MNKLMNSKKGFQINDLMPIGITLVVLGIVIAFGLQIMADTRSDFTANTLEYNATTDAMTGVAKIPKKLPVIATIIIASVIIGILLRYLYVRQ